MPPRKVVISAPTEARKVLITVAKSMIDSPSANAPRFADFGATTNDTNRTNIPTVKTQSLIIYPVDQHVARGDHSLSESELTMKVGILNQYPSYRPHVARRRAYHWHTGADAKPDPATRG